MNNEEYYDVLIIGMGSGLNLALSLPDSLKVAVLRQLKRTLPSMLKGISAVIDDNNSSRTCRGYRQKRRGLCRPEAVQFIVERSRSVNWLSTKGVSFSKRRSKSVD